MNIRKQIGIKLPISLIEVVDKIALRQSKRRTQFIEEAIREKLNSLNIKITEKRETPVIYYDNVEDIPLHAN